MKILICASEGAPYAKTGGLADVIGALPQSLKENGCDVRVIMPYYKKIKEKNIASYCGYAYVRINNRQEYVGVMQAVYNEITYYFIDNERYFGRDNLYGYDDDGERFAYFDFAVLEAIKVINFYPDVLHCNDWQTGLIPYIIKSNYQFYGYYTNVKTMFSIHNIQYQGQYSMDLLKILFLPYSNSLEFNGALNFMKCAIMEAGIVTTVSPTYKNEVLTPEYSYGLNDMLGLRYYDFYGIINGIDINKYNPKTDHHLFYNYDSSTVTVGKEKNKKALLEQFGLYPDLDAPLFGLVSRLVDQKGIDLFMPILEDVINYSNANFILMGSGDKKYEDYFNAMAQRYPNRFKCYIGYNDDVAQKIYAGADIFLMPSKFEPCGLGQMIAMRYGTLPLVRETGGLKDTVEPYNKYNGKGTGFSFTNYNSFNLKDVMFFAIDTYNDKAAWKNLVKQAMDKDYSWNKSAQAYIDLYKKL